ncbi:glycosyltransferase [Schaalia vaccimaxillae]|uniref:glycosyltransferase n=1 Tax=Schaalia vaccimaxillae TaxID=183916 RepID=UPI0003B5010F|nr:glycosyltransferase [Schaalia vaccimaxillae]
MDHVKVAGVVVAYNRAHMLPDTLDALEAQTRPLDALVVVDNASTDATADIAQSHPRVTDVVSIGTNLGGAGGFAAGIARAVSSGADLVWLMDDDTVPSATALEELLRARSRYPGTPALLACRANWIDGREHPMNTPRERFGVSAQLKKHAALVGAKQIRTASFVAVLIDARAIREEGLPVADYFLWNDDFEYTARLLRHRVGLYVGAARVEHRTKEFANSTDIDPGERFFNEVRNKMWVFTRSRALGPIDSAAFAGATALRWARMLARTTNKRDRLRDLARGFHVGTHTPRPTTEVLWDTPVGREVAVLEAGTPEHPAPSGKDVPTNLPFSVLLPVWKADRPEHFIRSIRSIGADQVRRPSQIVIVCDGPVDPRIDAVITACQKGRRPELAAGVAVTVVRIATNSGLANALNEGLAACRYEVVARADADDISLPGRFSLQIPLIEQGFELVGSSIAEFESNERDTGLVRRMPMGTREIRNTIAHRDPFNHPTVVYTKSAVASAGGYEHVDHMEDYWLFARMVHMGIPCCNLQEPLVLYRIGDGAYRRRGGMQMFHSELALQEHLLDSRIINPGQYARNVVVRGAYRLIPAEVRKTLYQNVGRFLWFR